MTIVGAVSPPGGDFSDPVTAQTLNIVQVLVTSPSRNSTTVLLFHEHVCVSLTIKSVVMFMTLQYLNLHCGVTENLNFTSKGFAYVPHNSVFLFCITNVPYSFCTLVLCRCFGDWIRN